MNLSRTQIIIAGLVFHILAAIFSIGYHHCDELFQVFEFAGYKLGLNNPTDLPWEFHNQMRSGIQPLIVYWLVKAGAVLSVNDPFQIATIARMLVSLLAFIAVCLFTSHMENEVVDEKHRNTLWLLTLLFWCTPYFHARFSSENLSATLFLFGLVLTLRKMSPSNTIAAGLLFGLAFVVRFQLIFMIAGLFAWQLIIRKTSWKCILLSCLGMGLAIGIGVLADKWLYGHYTFSSWNYLDQNLFHHKASAFGSEPFYYYLTESLLQLLPPFSILIVAGIFFFWWRFRQHVITWITLPFILLHCFTAHKELRFLFPVINFLPFMLMIAYQSMPTPSRITNVVTNKSFQWFFIVVNFLALLIFTFKPADEISFSLKKIYETLPAERAVLLYENDDPYGNAAALNFFRKRNVMTYDLAKDSLTSSDKKVFYFSRSFSSPAIITKGELQFEKIYSSYPAWFSHLNFNDWQSRSFSFSIYQQQRR